MTLRIRSDDSCYKQKLQNFLPERILVDEVEHHVDAVCDHDELDYLIGLKNNTQYNLIDIENALFYLQQSQKFDLVELYIEKKDVGYRFIFSLIKSKIVSRVAVSGLLRGKEQLKNHYLIELGDRFDQQKHQCSLDHMMRYLHDKGYFSARIIDYVTVDEQTKLVKILCQVRKKFRFKIAQTVLNFSDTGSVSASSIEKLRKQLESVYLIKLHDKPYSAVALEAMLTKINRLLQHKGYIDFEVSVAQCLHEDGKTMELHFDIKMARKRELLFTGVKFFTKEQILDHLLLYSKSTWHFPNSLIIDEIEQLYKSKGFWDVKVAIHEAAEQLHCFIQAGNRAVIGKVSCKQNASGVDDALIQKAWYPLLRARYFDQNLLKKVSDSIVKIYHQHGFWDAKIIKTNINFMHNNVQGLKVFHIEFEIHEGKQRYLGNVTIPDYPAIQQQLNTLYRCYRSKPFDSNLLQEQKQWIARWLRVQGYQKFFIEYELSSDDNVIVNVFWKITLSDVAMRMGKTIIVGNSAIKHRFLMQEVAYEQGKQWNKQNLETSLQNFRTLPVFDIVQLYPATQLDADLQKPIFVKLIEDDRYEIRTRFGLQQVGRNMQFLKGFTYKAGASLCMNNPFHAADQLFFDFDITRFYRNLDIAYQFPWLFGRKIGSQFKIYDNAYKQPVYIGSQDSLYRATQQGFLFNMNYKHMIGAGITGLLNGTLGLEFMGLYEGEQPDLNLIIDYDRNLLSKKIGYLFFEPNILFQNVDSMINPHNGFMTYVSCKGMFDLDTKTSFFKMLFEHSQYIACMDQVTLALRLRLGHVFNRYFSQINPIERFYLGGANSVRGYDRDYCPPLGLLTKPIYDQHAGLPECSNDIWRYAPQGGRTMCNLNCDLRLDVYKNFAVVIFTDFGALFKDSIFKNNQSWKDYFYAGSGVGIRYDTPIGPIRFDIGFKWKIQHPDFESRSARYLTLGQAF